MGVNLQGAFNVTHAFVEQQGQRARAIVNLCSIAAYGCGISTAGYVVSRAACAPSPKCWRATWRRMACGSTPSRPA